MNKIFNEGFKKNIIPLSMAILAIIGITFAVLYVVESKRNLSICDGESGSTNASENYIPNDNSTDSVECSRE